MELVRFDPADYAVRRQRGKWQRSRRSWSGPAGSQLSSPLIRPLRTSLRSILADISMALLGSRCGGSLQALVRTVAVVVLGVLG
jgi:hypothetical protein